MGRVEAGQLAQVRLEAFPWAQYGTMPARVEPNRERASRWLCPGRSRALARFSISRTTRTPGDHRNRTRTDLASDTRPAQRRRNGKSIRAGAHAAAVTVFCGAGESSQMRVRRLFIPEVVRDIRNGLRSGVSQIGTRSARHSRKFRWLARDLSAPALTVHPSIDRPAGGQPAWRGCRTDYHPC